MKTIALQISDGLAATLARLGWEPTGEFRKPTNRTEPVWACGYVNVSRSSDWNQDYLILRKLPEPQQAEPIQTGREYRTRDGREVRIWTTDAKASPIHPVRGEYKFNGEWFECEWSALGWAAPNDPGESQLDLVAPKECVSEPVVSESLLEGWVNVYETYKSDIHHSKVQADCRAGSDRLRCVHVREVVEPAEQGGEGL